LKLESTLWRDIEQFLQNPPPLRFILRELISGSATPPVAFGESDASGVPLFGSVAWFPIALTVTKRAATNRTASSL
jgi:hypothetical protein